MVEGGDQVSYVGHQFQELLKGPMIQHLHKRAVWERVVRMRVPQHQHSHTDHKNTHTREREHIIKKTRTVQLLVYSSGRHYDIHPPKGASIMHTLTQRTHKHTQHMQGEGIAPMNWMGT